MPKTRDIHERFWEKVDRSNECWTWQAATDWFGYGLFGVGSRTDGTRKVLTAHRVAYLLTYGVLSDREHVLHHKCENPACVRPDHLELVSMATHIIERHGKTPPAENARKTHCKNGHPLSGDNLLVDGPARRCRICRATHRRGRGNQKRGGSHPWAPLDRL